MQCTATVHKTGERCRRHAINGAEVCQVHGGAAPQVRLAAARRVRAQQLLKGRKVEDVEDNVALFRELIAEAAALKDVFREAITEAEDASDAVKAARGLADSLDRVARLISDFERLGLETRRVQLEELKVKAVTDAMRKVLEDLGHDPGDPEVRAAVRRAFTGLGSGKRARELASAPDEDES